MSELFFGLFVSFVLIFIGLAGGIAVGSGFVAFITVLDIVPRLAQLSRSAKVIHKYELAIICGVIAFTVLDFYTVILFVSSWVTIPIALFMGIFVGLLAAALTEVVNVFPILVKRLNMKEYLLIMLMAMALGKTCGSLFQFLIFQIW